MKTRNIRGRIAYLDPARVETGREWFSVSVYPDGARTLRCECHFDDFELVRDVTMTLGADFRPIDAYLRINHQGRPQGAGWFLFGGGTVRCSAVDAAGVQSNKTRAYVGPSPAFGAHPILNDGIWTALFDLKSPGVTQRLVGCITYSKELIGNESIGLETFDLDISYAGDQEIEVPAGRFLCRAFSAHIVGLEAPFKLWTWSDDYIIVKETWTQMPGSYELAELTCR
jgi:hypothetical protein